MGNSHAPTPAMSSVRMIVRVPPESSHVMGAYVAASESTKLTLTIPAMGRLLFAGGRITQTNIP